MTYHPHVYGIVPGGSISADGERWVACRPGFFLPVRVLSRLFRRLFLEKLSDAYHAGILQFFGQHQALAEVEAFTKWLNPLWQSKWVVLKGCLPDRLLYWPIFPATRIGLPSLTAN